MDNFVKRVYVSEIKKQCQYALSAIHHLNHSLQQINNHNPNANSELYWHSHSEVFRQVHSFLTHASNVSRMFWPPTPKRKERETEANYQLRLSKNDKVARAIALKKEYQLDDDNPLKDRKLRDHLEHFDERLDHWRNTSINRIIVSDIIGPPNAIAGPAATDMMRWFDPSRNVFTFRGEEYDLQLIATAIDQLLPKSVQLEDHLWNKQIGRA